MQAIPDPELMKAVDLFNRREFFDCHEVLEDLWRPLVPGPQKTFLQGLLQVAVGYHHLRNGNFTGTRNKLSEGLEKLHVAAQNPSYAAPIALLPLINAVEASLGKVEQLGPNELNAFPSDLIPQVQPV